MAAVKWFSQMKMDSFNDFIAAWEKQTDTARIFDSKHKDQFADIRDGAKLLQTINDSLDYRTKTNPDGSVSINPHTLNVEFNPILADNIILGDAILKIRNAAAQIMQQSSKRYAPGTELGTLAQGVINICNDFEKFHHDTKKDITKIALKDFYKKNKDSGEMPEKYLPSEKKNDEWFDAQKIAAAQVLVDNLKERFAHKPEAANYIKGIEENLGVLTAINTDVINNSAFKRSPTGSIANAKGEVTFSDKLDDPEISGASNGMITQKVLLTALNTVEPSANPVLFKKNQDIAAENTALLNQLSQFAESIFKNHREKKQNFEDGFLKDFYQNNHSSPPELSIASTTINDNNETSKVSNSPVRSSSHSIDYTDVQIDVSDISTPSPITSPPHSRSPSISESSTPEISRTVSTPTLSVAPVMAKPAEAASSKPAEKAPAANATQGTTSNTSWFKYAAMTAGILLGAAAIATGFGAVIGVPLLAISVASMAVSVLTSERGGAMIDRLFGVGAPAKNNEMPAALKVEPAPISRKINQSTTHALSQMKNFEKMKEMHHIKSMGIKQNLYTEVVATASPKSKPVVSEPLVKITKSSEPVVNNPESNRPRMR